MQPTIKLKATTSKLVLTKDNLNQFIKLSNRRDIRKCVVKKLKKLLEDGNHFETPLMSNQRGRKQRLLDGNHRFEAITQYIDEKPDAKVEILLFSYDNLTEDEEKEMYTRWNLGIKQNTNDFVKQYWNDIPIVKKMKANGFPWDVAPTWTSKAIEFKTIVSGYLTIDDKTFLGGYRGSAISFIERAKKLNNQDYNVIKEFLKEYMQVFGNPDKHNPHYKQAVFYSLFRVWIDNKSQIIPTSMESCFRRVMGSVVVISYTKLGGTRENCQQCRTELLRLINGARTKNLLV